MWILAPLATLKGVPLSVFLSGGVSAGGSSYVLKDSNEITSSGNYEVGGTLATQKYVASKFVATSSYSLNRVDVPASKVGSPTNDYFCEIWSDSGTLPSAKIGTTSAAVNGASFPASEAWVTFYPTATITSGTNYFIVIWTATNSGTDHILWYRNTSGTVERVDSTDDPGTGWSNLTTTRQCMFRTYGPS